MNFKKLKNLVCAIETVFDQSRKIQRIKCIKISIWNLWHLSYFFHRYHALHDYKINMRIAKQIIMSLISVNKKDKRSQTKFSRLVFPKELAFDTDILLKY